MARPFTPTKLESQDVRDDRIAKEIFTRIEDGGERIAQIVAIAFLGGAIGLAIALWQSGFFDPK